MLSILLSEISSFVTFIDTMCFVLISTAMCILIKLLLSLSHVYPHMATYRLRQGIDNEELTQYIANAVMRGLGKRSFRDAIRIARKCKTIEQVDETIQTMTRCRK